MNCLVWFAFAVCLCLLICCLFVCVFVCLPVCLSVCLSGWLAVCLFVCLFACLFACLLACLFVCLCLAVCSVCSVWLVGCLVVWLFVCLPAIRPAIGHAVPAHVLPRLLKPKHFPSPYLQIGLAEKGRDHRCPFWLIWSKNRGPWFTLWLNQLPGPYFPKKDTYGRDVHCLIANMRNLDCFRVRAALDLFDLHAQRVERQTPRSNSHLPTRTRAYNHPTHQGLLPPFA